MKNDLEKRCLYLKKYLRTMVIPSGEEYFHLVESNSVKVYHAFSFNSILAHAVDYMVLISKELEIKLSRTKFVRKFDSIFEVAGAHHINNKFRLVGAVNNSFKHVRLDEKRYPDLIKEYGEMSFHLLFVACRVKKQPEGGCGNNRE